MLSIERPVARTVLGLAIAAVLAGTAQAQDSGSTVSKRKEIAGQTYTFTKSIDTKGNVTTQILDGQGRIISARSVPAGVHPLASPALLDWLSKAKDGEQIQATIALRLSEKLASDPLESGAVEAQKGTTTLQMLDGKSLTAAEFDRVIKTREAALLEQRAALHTQRRELLQKWLDANGLSKHKGAAESVAQATSSVTLVLGVADVKRLLDAPDAAFASIEIAAPGKDDIAQAMVDTNITSWALPFSNTRGSGIGIYMTESGCADESRFTNYDRLAGSETDHSRNVGAIIKSVAPASFLYCRGSAVLPQSGDLDGVGGNPRIHIVTRSNSDNDNNDYTTLDRDWDNFSYDNLIATFNSGGNTGTGSGDVRSPAKGLNVIHIGNYNDSTNGIVASSPFNDPETGNDKPQVVAPGETINAGGFIMTGTSQATPHAAAFAADMMSASTYLQLRPHLVMAKLLAGATDSITGGYDKVGQGGIDFLSSQYNGHWAWWSGGNGAFNTFAQNDGGTSSSYIEHKVYISSGWDRVRVALAWMNRGNYTFDHRHDAHAIGMDLDLTVYAPDGGYIGGSLSWDNPHETVNFTPTQSGYYTFKVYRYANRDTGSNFRMGLYVNYYDL